MPEIINESGYDIGDSLIEACKNAFYEIVNDEKPQNGNAALVFVTNAQIKELNKKFRGADKETDVLSFPGDASYLGDIIISFEKAVSQAAELGHSLERELGFLTAHSTLHLCGYDHCDPESESEMIKKQEAALQKAGLYRR